MAHDAALARLAARSLAIADRAQRKLATSAAELAEARRLETVASPAAPVPVSIAA